MNVKIIVVSIRATNADMKKVHFASKRFLNTEWITVAIIYSAEYFFFTRLYYTNN